MKRLVVMTVAAVAAGGIAAAPALAGLRGNPSFSQQIPVPAPSQAKPPNLPAVDHGGLTRHPEPGNSSGGATPGVTSGAVGGGPNPSAEPSDDHGGSRGPGGGGGGSGSGS